MTTSYPNTWKGVEQAAKSAGARYPELVAAQWALESGWGQHTSGRHNYFGLKGAGKDCVTTEVINGESIIITDSFLQFASLNGCVQYLVNRWYKDFGKWKGVNRAVNRDAAACELKAQGYATDPHYADKLINLMDEHATSNSLSPKNQEYVTIKALRDTWLKKEPKQSNELGEDERVFVSVDKTYEVKLLNEVPTQAHSKVELSYGGGAWFIYTPHWRRNQAHGVSLPQIDWDDFNCLITPNLSVGEVLQWDSRRKPQGSMQARLIITSQEYQKVREAWGRPLGVTSFYRPEPINQQVGGVPGSRHVSGEAFDIYPVDTSLESFYQWIRRRWTGALGDGRSRGFVHLDRRAGGHFVPGAGVKPYTEWFY